LKADPNSMRCCQVAGGVREEDPLLSGAEILLARMKRATSGCGGAGPQLQVTTYPSGNYPHLRLHREDLQGKSQAHLLEQTIPASQRAAAETEAKREARYASRAEGELARAMGR